MNSESETTHIFLVRHGQTQANAQQYVGGSTDDPLTERGHEQASQVAEHLKTAAASATAIYTSPLRRAQETAGHISNATGLSLEVVEPLMEWDAGDWERLNYSDIPKQKGFKFEHLLDLAWAPPGGETMGSVQTRVVATTQELASRHVGQCIIVVSHGTALGLLLAKLFQENTGAWTQYKLENCSVSELKFGAVPELVSANQIAHLVTND